MSRPRDYQGRRRHPDTMDADILAALLIFLGCAASAVLWLSGTQ
ncbi:MAG TPA: hypothetical protein VFU47_14265 [Armatimonadota bacterium]|nr:hypothetical protein [Armatimonadota bacterium]